MAPVLVAPPEPAPATASSAAVVVTGVFFAGDDLVEEPMDYTPIAPGRLAAPDAPEEAWAEDGNGPMGF